MLTPYPHTMRAVRMFSFCSRQKTRKFQRVLLPLHPIWPSVAAFPSLCYLDVTRCNSGISAMSEQVLLSKQIEVLVGSTTLHGSESLCKLLRYLGKQAVEHPHERVKE